MIHSVTCRAFEIPLPEPESDGTLEWDSTGVLVVEVAAGGRTGLGYAYTQPAAAREVVSRVLAPVVTGTDPDLRRGTWRRMLDAVRNLGSGGVASSAVSAVDLALLDLDGRLRGIPASMLMGAVREAVPAYGSGGFTSLDDSELCAQLGRWIEQGMSAVKMKVGRNPERDPQRVRAARNAIGDGITLMVDANGAYSPSQAIAMAERFADSGVTWFEEPVSSDDLAGLRAVRDHVPPGMEVTAGEYGWDSFHFERLVTAGCIDVMQADATRCGGATGFMTAESTSWSRQIELSAHTAPTAHAHLMACARRGRHVEFFHDHARAEALLFDGALDAEGGRLRPDPDRPGLGIELKEGDVEQWEV